MEKTKTKLLKLPLWEEISDTTSLFWTLLHSLDAEDPNISNYEASKSCYPSRHMVIFQQDIVVLNIATYKEIKDQRNTQNFLY